MEPAVARPLRNLALIYLALAHGTDHELTNDEVALMADRLRLYLDGGLAQGTVVQAISEALRRHRTPSTRPATSKPPSTRSARPIPTISCAAS